MLHQWQGTAPFTELYIRHVFGPDDFTPALARILAWPKALERFSCHAFKDAPYMKHFVPTYLHTLMPYRNSLKLLEVFPDDPFRTLFSFSEFPCLETLRLSWANVRLHYVQGARWDLLPPSLKTLGWVFTSRHDSQRWKDFALVVEEWLPALAQAAIARHIPLDTIEIIFDPEFNFTAEQPINDYPWDQIDRLKGKLIKQGICVKYVAPKSEWLSEYWSEFDPIPFAKDDVFEIP